MELVIGDYVAVWVTDQYHLFQTWSKVIPFWQDIHKCLEKIFCDQIPFDFLDMYLGMEIPNKYSCRETLNENFNVS